MKNLYTFLNLKFYKISPDFAEKKGNIKAFQRVLNNFIMNNTVNHYPPQLVHQHVFLIQWKTNT